MTALRAPLLRSDEEAFVAMEESVDRAAEEDENDGIEGEVVEQADVVEERRAF